jgi:tetratricopeptide (TPR) repeat protein
MPLFLITVFAFILKTVVRTSDWKNEETLYNSGIKVNPRNAKLYNNLGHLYEKKADFAMAMQYFQKAYELQPDDLGTSINIARTHLNSGDAKKAEQILFYIRPKVLTAAKNNKRIPPNYLHLWINLGNILSSNASRISEAEAIYLELINLREDYVDGFINLGDVYVKSGKIPEAINVYQKALLLPKSGKEGLLLYNLGVVHSLLLNRDASTKKADDSLIQLIASYFLKSLEIMPNNRDALLNLAILMQDHPDRLQQEKTVLIRLMQSYEGPDKERIFFNLALLFADAGNRRSADHFLRKALSINPNYPSALFNLALILGEESKLFESESYLEQLLKIKPDHAKGIALAIEISGSLGENHKIKDLWNRLVTLKKTLRFSLPKESQDQVCLIVSKIRDLKISLGECNALLSRSP